MSDEFKIETDVFKIDNDIPVPRKTTVEHKYPFAQMKVGDSFAYPSVLRKRVDAAAFGWCKRRSGWRFTARRINDKQHRIWRIADDDARQQPGKSPPITKPSIALGRRLETFELSVRTLNRLTGEGIETLGDLLKWTSDELIGIPAFGQRCLAEVEMLLEKQGLRLKEARR